MTRQRLLEIILAVVAVLFIPGYLINLYVSHRYASATSAAPATDPRFKAAFDAGVTLEQNKEYEQAISKFLEAEMYAGKMQDGKYPAFEAAIEHYASCNQALGRDDSVLAARKQLIRMYIEEAEMLKRANQFEAAVTKLQQAEEGAQQFDHLDEPLLDISRQSLIDALWKLKRYSEVDEVFDRMIASVRQPLNDYSSVLGQEYTKIAMWRSKLPDWAGTEKACSHAIEEYDRTIQTYSSSDPSGNQLTSGPRFGKAMAMYWLEIAYAREGKEDLALTAADNAFQYNAELHGPATLGRDIAKLALDVAKKKQQSELMSAWQKRLRELPSDPCPVPNINNPNCITPVPATASIPSQATR